MMLVEPFAGYRQRPTLRCWKGRKTMTVAWDDCGMLSDYLEFKSSVDCDAMNAALLEIWKRYKPQCGRRASFSRGSVIGCMEHVPVAAGVEAMAVVREYFTRALKPCQELV